MLTTQAIGCQLIPDAVPPGSLWWRHGNFKPGKDLPCGCQNFSPAAFLQGHAVGFICIAGVQVEDGAKFPPRG